MSPSDSTLVIVPTYNEASNLRPVVQRIRAATPTAHVLVADDGSPDGTGTIADAIAASDDHVHVLHRRSKQGLGAAYLAGFAWGVERGFEVLVEMDGDGSHQPEQLGALLEAIDAGADLVLGSRWVAGGSVVNWPLHRKLLSLGGNVYTRLVLGLRLGDATGGYRAFRRTALAELNLSEVASQGYCFQVDLARRAVGAGLSVAEVPITFVERTHGESKMSSSIVREALWRVTLWGLQARVGRLRQVSFKHRVFRARDAEATSADAAGEGAGR